MYTLRCLVKLSNLMVKQKNEAFLQLSIANRLVVDFVSCPRPVPSYAEIRTEICLKLDIEYSRLDRGRLMWKEHISSIWANGG